MSSNLSIENLAPRIEIDSKSTGMSGVRKPQDLVPDGASFGQMLEQSLEKVNSYQNQADQAMKELISGRTKNVHETMLAVEKADASLKLMMQVRNKVLEAYKEIIKMQV